ncbi:MAG: Wzt carbohydrate-binding domain-containing protein [Candidatus Omnitrophica bacterium]|nr:Wzt carbohydrate-binding domain-containing protein [Candidatus Omnitrophota bacterium]MDD5552419.1 Wzt carbohydrate-binding domain-containing protein [Candidatus Omnitrophota bacterium]
MTTSPTKLLKNNYKLADRAIEMRSVDKVYQFLKITGRHIGADFDSLRALKNISFNIYKGEILGIIGRNGAGKTTLLNIIAGVLSPTRGEIKVTGKVLGLFNLGIGFQDQLTGRENIFLNGALMGAAKKELEDKLGCIIEFSELGNFIDMPLGTYSQGMRLRLGFSIIVNLDFDILAIDEVLAVGDALFQSKCFERLMDLRRSGKTLVVTNQGMDLVERLCDNVVLLDHGRMLFYGNTTEGVNKYHALLKTEKFFVGLKQETGLVENTKKWAEDTSNWGNELGTKEAAIKKVELINKSGLRPYGIRSGKPLRIKVYFEAKNPIKEPHFGIAIFRQDGVYCYGPNTKFDGHDIPEISPGKGYFELFLSKLLLAPGEYRVSVAIWDKNETLPFSYREGYYKLIVKGNNKTGQLLNLPCIFHSKAYFNLRRKNNGIVDPSMLDDKWGLKIDADGIRVDSVKILDHDDKEQETFITGGQAKLIVSFDKPFNDAKRYVWLGIYRDDGVYCQGISQRAGRSKDFKAAFLELPLLPGGYKISIGVWDGSMRRFLMYHHGIYPFRMVFNRKDHGTVYLQHKWRWTEK